MTKYILVGGYPYKATDGGKAFAEALTEGKPQPVKLLECLFARPPENWQKAFAQNKEFFEHILPNKKLDIRLAEIKKFAEQVRWADSVYIRGGENERLLPILKQNKVWRNELDGKTLAGSSAGANALSKYFCGLDDPVLGEGLGIVPVKVLVHYRSDYNSPNIDWDKAEAELKAKDPSFRFLPLAEGQFEVISI